MLTEESLFAWGWTLFLDSPGHGGCGGCDGWTFDPRDGQLICSCGAVLFELGPVVTEAVAA